MSNFKVIKIEQTNPYYDPDKAYDGGGYDQPKYTFLFRGIQGTFTDSSCGAFGMRYDLNWNGLMANYDDVGRDIDVYSDFDPDNSVHAELLHEIQQLTGYKVVTKYD